MPDEVAFLQRMDDLPDAAPALLQSVLRRGGSYADLFYERTVHQQVTLRHRLLRGGLHQPAPRHTRRHLEGVGMHAFGGENAGFATTDDLSAASLQAVASTVAAQMVRSLDAAQVAPLNSLESYLDLPPDAPEAIADSERESLLREAVDAAFALDEQIIDVKASYQDRVRRTLVATSEGGLEAQASTLLGLRVAVTLKDGARTVSTHAMTGGAVGFGHFFEQTPERVAREAVERAQRLTSAQPLPPGTMPVVLAGGWGGVWLHEAVGHWLEADAVANGTSPFAGKQGQRIASPGVHLVDDATLIGGRGSYASDDEGTTGQCTTLIVDGVLRGLLTDRRYAQKMDLACTGNGRRQDYRHAPLPRMTNLLLLGGNADLDDLLAEVKNGLYVTSIGHGSVCPGEGFVFNVLDGYRIEQGQFTTPVANVRILGEEAEVLKNMVGISRIPQVDHARGICQKAGQVVPVSVGMPPVLIREMQVAPIL